MVAPLKSVVSMRMSVRFLMFLALVSVSACETGEELPPAPVADEAEGPMYLIGPGDGLRVFVWREPELSTGVTVRPDGRISIPLIEDLVATEKTPAALAREIEAELKPYVQDPFVTVIVTGFSGPPSQQIRVLGQAASPQAIPFRANMTLLDVMIATGGLTEFADGNGSVLVRNMQGVQKEYQVRLDDLVRDGDITANAQVRPGDVLIIPEGLL